MSTTVIDARGQRVTVAKPPQRIVSLVPSTTESLFDLGAGQRVVGCTRFCVHPAQGINDLVRVGGTKDLELGRLQALAPDLVVANAEENTTAMFDAIADRWPLWVAFPRTVDDAIDDLLTLGRLLDAGQGPCSDQARRHIAAIQAARRPDAVPWRFAYLIWRGPWMAVSQDTFISAMLAELGGVNVCSGGPRYPELTPAWLAEQDPDVVLLSSEPFPFADRHADELATLTGLPRERFVLCDGELCSWHGTRMALALPALRALAPVSGGCEVGENGQGSKA